MSAENPRSAVSARQAQIYGESWSDRLHRLMAGYHLSQARLAAVIGLSAPMLSQLITGQRTKISNPAVYGRVVALEEALADPSFPARGPEQVAELLERTAASQPVLSTRTAVTPGRSADDRAAVVAHLAALAHAGSLRAAADAARATAPALAELLEDAAGRS